MKYDQTLIVRVDHIQHESFTYEIGEALIAWDVTEARARCDAGRTLATVEIERDVMQGIVNQYAVDAVKLDRVDPTIPGISAPIIHEGNVIYVLIDGTHRCARALRDGLPFSARILADDAAAECVLTAPPGVIPGRK